MRYCVKIWVKPHGSVLLIISTTCSRKTVCSDYKQEIRNNLNYKYMQTANWKEIKETKKAAIEVLLIILTGHTRTPRTAGWGYPEPYTRDLMFPYWELAFLRIRS